MKEESTQKVSKLFYVGLGFVGILIVLILGLFLHSYWKGKIDDTNGYNSVNAVFTLIALGINFLTVFFVFFTYRAQKETIMMQAKQIEDNKKDLEFNRALDIVYKQLDHSKQRFIVTDEEYDKYNLKGAEFKTLFADIDKLSELVFWYYNESFFYIKFLDNSTLSKQYKLFLMKVYLNNIPARFDNIIKNLRVPVLKKSEDNRLLYEKYLISKYKKQFGLDNVNNNKLIASFSQSSNSDKDILIKERYSLNIKKHLRMFDKIVDKYSKINAKKKEFMIENKEL